MKAILLSIAMVTMTQFCQAESGARFEPPKGKRLLVLGQDLGAIGGFPAPNDNGYVDHIRVIPGGLITYTDLAHLGGVRKLSNLGSGDTWAQAIVDQPIYRNSVIAMGLYMVNSEKNIADGKLDNNISALAEWIRESRRPVLLRIGYEFDGSWNHYDPEAYKLAFQRIVNRLRELKVENCATVWQASTSPVNGNNNKDIQLWYPGDEYVDWFGYSWFLSTSKQVELTDKLLQFARDRKKPVMVCESAPQGYDTARLTRRNIGFDGKPGQNPRSKTPEEIWTEWFVPFLDYIDRNQDLIRIVAYINVNWDAQAMWGPPYRQGYWGDSRLEANPVLKEKWLTEINKPAWLRASPSLFTELGYQKGTGK